VRTTAAPVWRSTPPSHAQHAAALRWTHGAVRLWLSHRHLALGANVALVPAFGAMGAATALGLTAVGATLMTGLALSRQFGALIRPATCLRGLVATAVMAGLAHYLVWTGPWLLLKYLLLGVYGGVLAVLREVDAEDVAALALWRQRQV
jgi:O-antigen/teichoic acid export membrane protein